MKTKLLYLFVLIGLIQYCNDNSKVKNAKDEVINNVNTEVKNQADPCKCFYETGSKPIIEPALSFLFSNQTSVVFCGHKEQENLTGFDLLNCKTGESITKYEVSQTCQVYFRNDTIEIIELKYLPTYNWERKLIPIGKEIVIGNSSSIKTMGQVPFFNPPNISKTLQEDFLDEFELNKSNGMHEDWAWEEILGKLEVLSLMGNQRAEQIILNLEKMANYQLEGYLKEVYKKSLANIKWVKK